MKSDEKGRTKKDRWEYGITTCQRKAQFKSRLGAWKAAKRIKKMTGKELGAYKCRYCHRFHLSHKVLYTPPKKLSTPHS